MVVAGRGHIADKNGSEQVSLVERLGRKKDPIEMCSRDCY